MPRRINKKIYKKPARKKPPRVYRGIKYKGRFNRNVVRGAPYQVNTILKMQSEAIELDGAATSQEYIFALNDLYNPLGVHSNNQPYLYDRYDEIYNKYRVYRGSFAVTFINETANPVVMVYCYSQDVGAIGSARLAAEQNNGRTVYITAANGSKNKGMIKFRWNSYRFLKGSSIADQTASFGASPTARLYLHVFVESVKYDATPANVDGIVFVNAKFYSRIFAYDRPAVSDK